MHLTTKPMLVCLAATAVLLALVALHVTDRGPASCDDADAAMRSGLLVQAAEDYDKILAEEPGSTCAIEGNRRVAKKACDRAWLLVRGGAVAEARTAFAAMLVRSPPNRRQCATNGLRATAPKAQPDPKPTPSRLTVVVKSERGEQGDRGEKGEKGEKGDAARDLTKIIIYCDVRRWRACRMRG